MNLFFLTKNKNTIALYIYILGSILATVVAAFLIHKSLPLNSQVEQEYQNNIDLEKQHLSSINIALPELQQINSNRDISQYFQKLDSNYQKLANIPNFISTPAKLELKKAITNNSKILVTQKQLIEDISTEKSTFKNACNYVATFERELLKTSHLSDQSEQVIGNLNELLQNTLFYCLSAEDSLVPVIKTKIQILERLINNENREELELQESKLIVQQLIQYTQVILQYKLQVQSLFDQLEATETWDSIQDLDKIYQNDLRRAIASINTYRLICFFWFLLVIILVAYKIINNLKKTNQSIVKVLEKFTEELEKKVEQRTAELEESIQKTEAALAQAQNANEAKSRFLANMSHELRTPLNAILGFTQLMWRDTSIKEEHQENLKIINRSGEHLLKLINDILEMSKIEVGQAILNENTFDLYIMLQSLEDMLRLKAKAKNLNLVFIKDSNTPQYIKTDEGKLRQILINLLGNALKFTEQGSITLKVSLKKREQSDNNQINFLMSDLYLLNFVVEDTGPGIEAAEIKQLFTPFEQTKIGLQSKEGTGLGLSICQKFVELMGGEIQVDSKVGEGTKFTFDILIRTIDQINTIHPEAHLQTRQIIGLAPGLPKYRILAVDDVEASRLLLQKMLTAIGFEVRQASNGEEAIAVWQQWQPHLILMDMRMPIMDGYEATEQIKSQPEGQNTIVIALTASAFEEERLVILSAGCDDFMRKPFKESELLETIGNHLEIDYIYADETDINRQQGLKSQSTVLESLTPESLAVMSSDWLLQLNQAASQVDNQEIFRLLTEIPAEYESLAQELRILVEQFRCDKIIDLTEANNI